MIHDDASSRVTQLCLLPLVEKGCCDSLSFDAFFHRFRYPHIYPQQMLSSNVCNQHNELKQTDQETSV